MSVEDNKKLALRFLEDRSAGNIGAVLDVLSDDLVWWVPGNLEISGTKTKRELAALIEQVTPSFDGGIRITPKGITAEGDRVALEAESYGKLKNGKIFQNTYHLLFVVRDGKIVMGKEYMDTLVVSELLHT